MRMKDTTTDKRSWRLIIIGKWAKRARHF